MLKRRPRGCSSGSSDRSSCESEFLIAFHFVPWSVPGAPRFMLWSGNFPFVCYAPLFATCAWRRHNA